MGSKLSTWAVLVSAVSAMGGCRNAGSPVPCMSMSAPSELVSTAAAFRVDVYPAASRCDEVGGPSGAPIFTLTFAAGQALSFHVGAGKHPVVLSAFSDASATQLLGSACTDAELDAGRLICLDLTLQAPADMSPTLACDPQMPSTCGAGTCCDNGCRDTSSLVQYCGGCRACSAAHVATPMCMGGLCQPACSSGFGNCTQPAAPANDDGCETDLTATATDCGACGRRCSSTHAAALACAGGACTSTCSPGFGNCAAPAAPAADDGCETDLTGTPASCGACGRACATTFVQTAACVDSVCAPTCQAGHVSCAKPAAPAVDDGCECVGTACCAGNTCQLQHANGLGQTFLDCVALGTHTVGQATAARVASVLVATTDFSQTCTDLTPVLCRQTATECACWGYDAATAPGSGHVHLNAGSNTCMCPSAGDPAWN